VYGLLAGLAVVLVAVGWLGSVRAGDGLRRTTTVVDGVPLTFVRPATGGGPYPGAVVVHGYAGSARLMQPFADTLARNGYVVVLPDLAGHGASTRPLADPLSDVDLAVRSVREQSDVDPDRIVLVGHSRGASAVTDYGGRHPDIAATVALSLGTVPAVVPRNLFVLYGELEFFLVEPTRQTLQRAGAGEASSTGRTYGSIADGSAVRAEVVPGVEHVGILYSPVTHERTLAWLDATVRPGTGVGPVHPLDRLWPAGLLLLGLLVGFVPLAGLALRGVALRSPTAAASPTQTPPGVPSLVRVGPALPDLMRSALAVAGGLVAGFGVGAVVPDPALGLAVGGYVALVVVAFGLGALGVAAVIWSVSRGPAGPAPGPEPRSPRWIILRVAPLVAYAAAMVVVPIQTGLTWVRPNEARLVPLLALLVAAWALFGAAERLGLGRWYLHAAVLAAPLGLLFVLVVVGAPAFLVLVLPLLAALLAIGAGVAAVLRRFAVPWWLTAAVAAPPFAWTAATAFPLA
jgi:pimeloyl-ACP methyl ester carboxylesterase